MVELKLTINDTKAGKSYSKVSDSEMFMNMKIGDAVQGDQIGFKGYKFIITGGTDKAGFPMRWDVQGTQRRKPLLSSGPGIKIATKGMRKRKSVAGNTISNNTAQINIKVTEYGSQGLDEMLGTKKEEVATEEKPVEQAAKEKKAPKKENKDEKV